MLGTQIGSRYRILERLGEGAMGVVYRARDERLEREVAVKVIRPELLSDETIRRRFRTEALALSQVNHPNVVIVFDFARADGVDFLVMELLGGTDLETRIGEGPLPEHELLAVAIQLASGMRAAHERQIVHRDLKPANLMLENGQLKILDFGLAARERGEESIAGTPAYMAPELLRGAAASEASDVYAVGVILFELATGRLPFEQRELGPLLRAIMNEQPPRPRSVRPEVSASIDDLVAWAMAKEPTARPAARDLLRRLHEIQRAEPARERRDRPHVETLVVFAFDDLSDDAEQGLFSAGTSDSLIADLARVPNLRVVSHAQRVVASARLETARELGADAFVEGSAVRHGSRLRVAARLVHATTESVLWSGTFERELADVLRLQADVARAVVLGIELKLDAAAQARLEAPQRVDPRAYEAYLRGRHHWNRRTVDALEKSVDYFERAIGIDPSYAMAHVGLADAYNMLGFYDALAPSDAFPRAKTAAKQALAIDPTVAEARVSLGYVRHLYEWDFSESEREYRRAIAEIPSYASGHQFYLELLVTQRRFGEALVEGRSALESDPRSLVVHLANTWPRFFMRHYERVIGDLRNVQAVDPDFVAARYWCGEALLQGGRHDEAYVELRKADDLAGPRPATESAMARALIAAHRTEEALGIVRNLARRASRTYVSPYVFAAIFAALGRHDEAFLHLTRAVEERSHWLTFLDVDPRFDALRRDPRFDALAKVVRHGGPPHRRLPGPSLGATGLAAK